MDAPQHPSQSKDLVLEVALARCLSWGLAAPCPVRLPFWHGVPAEPTPPAHSLRPAQTGGLGKARKEPCDYSATNRSQLSASFARVGLVAAARIYLLVSAVDPEAVNPGPSSCRAVRRGDGGRPWGRDGGIWPLPATDGSFVVCLPGKV